MTTQVESRFFKAVNSGDIKTVKECIASGGSVGGVDVDATNAQGVSALMCATMDGSLGMMDCLLSAGCDVNLKNPLLSGGETALRYATSVEVAEKLIKAGADVNAQAYDGFTVLMYFCVYRTPEMVRLLVDSGADVNFTGTSDLTPLAYASGDGSVETVDILLAAGADVNAKNRRDQKTALHYAARHGNIEIVKRLFDAGADLNTCDTFGNPPITPAIYGGMLDVIEAFLEAGCSVPLMVYTPQENTRCLILRYIFPIEKEFSLADGEYNAPLVDRREKIARLFVAGIIEQMDDIQKRRAVAEEIKVMDMLGVFSSKRDMDVISVLLKEIEQTDWVADAQVTSSDFECGLEVSR